jgi:uncharacterized membrane protein HdeD (DUF308 family)
MAKKKTDAALISALLYVALGVLLIVFRSGMLGIAMTIAGIVFVVSGILEVAKKNWASGAISLIIGIAILVLGWVAAQIVLLVLGILIALKGIIALVEALGKKKVTLLGVLFPVLTIVVGLMLAFGNGLDILLVICGVLLALDGVIGLINAIK